jgi:hypothetical protein
MVLADSTPLGALRTVGISKVFDLEDNAHAIP